MMIKREGVGAQGERARPLPQPRLPSRQEVQEHELTHIPYRSWCVHCVRGAGRSDAHRRRARQDEEEREQYMTTWSIDYAFMIDTGVLCTREEMERVGWDKTRDTVIAKRGNAPTIPVNSPVGDSQSNGRVENAIKKVRNMVKTILSSLESRWSIRVARDHPVYPWVLSGLLT